MLSSVLGSARRGMFVLMGLSEDGKLRSALDAGLRLGDGVVFNGSVNWGSEPWLIEVGSNTEFSGRVTCITHDGGTKVWRHMSGVKHLNRYGPIRVGNNCFIGYGVILLPDVCIGDNCVIGAGSVVARDIESNSVAAGVPARVLASIEDYGARAERETLLEEGHRPEELWRAVWKRFNERLASRPAR